jgi:propanol-preferring alcohol dehydrogenase
LIGFRSYSKIGEARRLGLYGFGAAAHLLTQLAVAEGRQIYAFTRSGDLPGQQFARDLGAAWAGSSDEKPPELLDAAILFAPVGELVPKALGAVKKGGIVVCGGIHMSNIPQFPYELLWGERTLLSVANLTREDATRYMHAIQTVPLQIHIEEYALAEANEALARLKSGRVRGAAVLVMPG